MFAAPLLLAALLPAAPPAEPLALHPDNPHYFLFRGKPTVLVTSGEHYGAVLNPDFDYVKYLDELNADGLNLTRTFSGVYCEAAGVVRHHRQHARPDGRQAHLPRGPGPRRRATPTAATSST